MKQAEEKLAQFKESGEDKVANLKKELDETWQALGNKLKSLRE